MNTTDEKNVSPEPIRIAIVCLFFNAGETTRAVEIAKALQSCNSHRQPLELQFFSSLYSADSYQNLIVQADFAPHQITYVGKGLSNAQWQEIQAREHAGGEFFLPHEQHDVLQMLLAMKQALGQYQPTCVVHGFTHNLDGPVAASLLDIPHVLYLPVPNSVDFFQEHIVTDVPPAWMPYLSWWCPLQWRRALIHALAFSPHLPSFHSPRTVRAAAVEAGWHGSPRHGMLTDLLASDLVLVNDLPGNFDGIPLPKNHLVTGPIFAQTEMSNHDNKDPMDPRIAELFGSDDDTGDISPHNPRPIKVFIAMGSSGHQDDLVQAIAAVNTPDYHTVALVPPSVGTVEEIRAQVMAASSDQHSISPTLYLTHQFVPSALVNPLADVAILHGGQGTVQTALASGTPIVGVAVTLDQEFNLARVQERGAGIQIPPAQWQAATIQEAVQHVTATDSSYRPGAAAVQREILEAPPGAQVAAEAIWDFARSAQATRATAPPQ